MRILEIKHSGNNTKIDHNEFRQQFYNNDEKIGEASMLRVGVVLNALGVDDMPQVEFFKNNKDPSLYGCKMKDVADFMEQNDLTFDLSAGKFIRHEHAH